MQNGNSVAAATRGHNHACSALWQPLRAFNRMHLTQWRSDASRIGKPKACRIETAARAASLHLEDQGQDYNAAGDCSLSENAVDSRVIAEGVYCVKGRRQWML